MIATILFFISIIAVGQFGIYYWRASIAATSKVPVSDRVRVAAGISTTSLSSRDFQAILNVHDLTPDLRGPAGKFRAIRAYFLVAETLGHLIPSVTDWAEVEKTMCSHYIAVLVDQHLERNMACAVRMRGM
ncbi:MAG: hypothetical protein LAN18_07220 [Acidobacteriia bacterium]|nr:hypothetical protein [Terriglobia bacterium]